MLLIRKHRKGKQGGDGERSRNGASRCDFLRTSSKSRGGQLEIEKRSAEACL
jgi:hypothetical protein